MRTVREGLCGSRFARRNWSTRRCPLESPMTARGMLFPVAYCVPLLIFGGVPLSVAYCVPLVAGCVPLSVAYCVPLVAYCVPLVAYCVPLVAYCVPPLVAYCVPLSGAGVGDGLRRGETAGAGCGWAGGSDGFCLSNCSSRLTGRVSIVRLPRRQ